MILVRLFQKLKKLKDTGSSNLNGKGKNKQEEEEENSGSQDQGKDPGNKTSFADVVH